PSPLLGVILPRTSWLTGGVLMPSFEDRLPGPRFVNKISWWVVAAIILGGCGAVLLVGWWVWPETRQRRVDRLREWQAVPRPAGRTIPDFSYWGRDPSAINADIENLGPDFVPELCVALKGIGRQPEVGLTIIRELERIDRGEPITDPEVAIALFP